MEKIIDIYGHSTSFNKKHPTKEDWYGRILVGEDNEFEGIVEGPTREDFSLIFGQITDVSLVFTKCMGDNLEVAYRYDGLKQGRKYIGTHQSQDLYVEVPLGECQITLMPAEVTREESDYERDGIKERIRRVKANLGELGTTLHHQFVMTRAEHKEIVKTQMEGK